MSSTRTSRPWPKRQKFFGNERKRTFVRWNSRPPLLPPSPPPSRASSSEGFYEARFCPLPIVSFSGMVKITAHLRVSGCDLSVDCHRLDSVIAQTARCPTWRLNLAAKSILPRLAHHRRHRFRQNIFRDQSTGPPGV